VNSLLAFAVLLARSYGDFLHHDERSGRAEKFLEVCNFFWRREGEVDFEDTAPQDGHVPRIREPMLRVGANSKPAFRR
jgi:hypothetical protein